MATPKNRKPSNPIDVLVMEYLNPLRWTLKEFAEHVDIPLVSLMNIWSDEESLGSDEAWKLARATGTTPEYWMSLDDAVSLFLNKDAGKWITRITKKK